LFPKASVYGEATSIPIVLLDDADALRDVPWTVVARASDAHLKQLKESTFSGSGSIKQVERLGEFTLTADETSTSPLFVVTEVRRVGAASQRNYYLAHFAGAPGSLFHLPKTRLAVETHDGQVTVKNEGNLPAVG